MNTWMLVILLASDAHIADQVVKEYWIYSDCKEDLRRLERELKPKRNVVVSMACEPIPSELP